MKFYATKIPQTLPDWANAVTESADLFEVEINDTHPNFQSLLQELATEIEPGTIGVKAKDLCSRLAIEMSNPHLQQLVEQAQNLITQITEHREYKQRSAGNVLVHSMELPQSSI